jgi:hypothetical protein
MSNIMTILQNSYANASANSTPPAKPNYVNVNGRDYQGTWTGNYSDGQHFSLAIDNVTGYHATVRFQLGSVVTRANVLISNASFHVADSKFILGTNGNATLATAVSNTYSGAVTVKTAAATRL